MKNIKINSILNLIKTLSGIIFPLITFPYVSRILQPENIGKINFGQSYVSYFSLIATLGITTYAIRECSMVKNNKKMFEKKASEIFSINICTTILSYTLLIISLLIFHRITSYRTVIVIQSISILFTALGADWLNTAMEDFTYITIRTVLFQIISLCLMFYFVQSKDDYLKYASITVFATSGANLLNIFYRKKYCNLHFTLDMKMHIHIKPILLLFVMILAQTIFNSADITMLGLIKGDYEVGIYSTAVKIQNIVSQIVSSLAWVVMPRMSIYFAENNYEKINQMLKKILGILLLIGFPSIAGVLSLSKEIVVIVGGAKYISASIPLMVLMVSFLFGLLGGSFLGNMVLLPSKNEKLYMIICCISTFVNLILNFIFIPYGGAVAAAGTTAFSALIILLLLLKYKDKNIKLDYIKEVGQAPLLGSLLIIAYCILISRFVHSILLKTFVCMIGSIFLYVITMIVMKNTLCMELIDIIKNRIKK